MGTCPSRRTTHRLGQHERNGIWSCFGPGWRAFYAWHETGWQYCTRDAPYWRETTAGLRDVCAASITSSRSDNELSFEFQEIARLGPPSYLFDGNGTAIPVPASMLGGI